MPWIKSGPTDPPTQGWLQDAGFIRRPSPDTPNEYHYSLDDPYTDEPMLTVHLDTDRLSCAVKIGAGGGWWPWDVWHKQTIRDLCLAVGYRVKV